VGSISLASALMVFVLSHFVVAVDGGHVFEFGTGLDLRTCEPQVELVGRKVNALGPFHPDQHPVPVLPPSACVSRP
jgi:hypothetical protein